WLCTVWLPVCGHLPAAAEGGMVLASILYIRRVVQTTTVTEITDEDVEDGRAHVLQDKHIPDYVSIFRIHGPFLFGATDKLDGITQRITGLQPIVVLRLRNMTAI